MGGSYIMGKDADFYAQNTTTFKVIDSSGNMKGNTLCAGSTSIPVASSAGVLYFKGAAISAESSEINASTYDLSVQIISSGAASTATAIKGYGITVYQGDTACSLPMSAPVQAGLIKTIIFTQGSSIARSICSSNTTGSTDNDRGFTFYSTACTNSTSITMTTGSTLGATLQLLAQTTIIWLPLRNNTSHFNFTVDTCA